MRLSPLVIQNVIDGHLNLRDVILETCLGNNFLFVKLTFNDFRIDRLQTTLMVVRFDKFNRVMFWEDAHGGHHDVTKCKVPDGVSYIKDKLDNAAEIYVFEIQLTGITFR